MGVATTCAPAGAVLNGVGVGRQAVIGPVALVQAAPLVPADMPILVDGVPADAAGTRAVVEQAFTDVAASLSAQAARATGTMAEVLRATSQMASDPALRGQVLDRVDSGEPAVAALDAVVQEFAATFEAVGGYLAERVTDLHSVRDRVVAAALGLPEPGVRELHEPSVVVARDLAPADTAALDLAKVLAIVTELGGPTGHTAIIAGQLGIPCLVRVDGVIKLPDDTRVAVDTASETLTVAPDERLVAGFAARTDAEQALVADTAPGTTSDGHRVALLANIGTGEDAERMGPAPTEGVGLFRTEVLFLERASAPTVEAQAATYTRVLAALSGRKVVVRSSMRARTSHSPSPRSWTRRTRHWGCAATVWCVRTRSS
jgi:phosphoenolpyruvate-protein phosphotransferase (PTS system enzyme I)